MKRWYVLLLALVLATAGCFGGGGDEDDDSGTDDPGADNDTGTGNDTDDGAGNDTDTGDGTGNDTDTGDGTGGDNDTAPDEPANPDPSEPFLDQSFTGSGEATFTVPADYARLRVGVENEGSTHTSFTLTLTTPDGEDVTIAGGAAGLAPESSCHWSNVSPGAAGEWSVTIEADNPVESLRVLVYGTDSIDTPEGDTQGTCSVPTDEGDGEGEG